jgi:hypothetical protein
MAFQTSMPIIPKPLYAMCVTKRKKISIYPISLNGSILHTYTNQHYTNKEISDIAVLTYLGESTYNVILVLIATILVFLWLPRSQSDTVLLGFVTEHVL